ncbi:MAG: hypothetical protein Q8Q48_01325, partial [Candidatus Staskawiczbacteria bacterium]|nr:hypothetical protein [Candidatus Staskawiczbacteria bacterium]
VPDSPPPKAPAEQSPTDEELSEDRRVRPDWDNAPQPKLENEVPIDPSSKLAEFQPPPPAEGPEIRPDDKSTDTVGGEIFDPTEEPPPAEQLTTPTVAAEIMRGLIRGKDNHIYWEEPLSRARKFIEAVEEKKPPTARTPEPEVIVERRVIGKDGKIKIEGPEPPTPARHADDLDLNDIRRHPMSP